MVDENLGDRGVGGRMFVVQEIVHGDEKKNSGGYDGGG